MDIRSVLKEFMHSFIGDSLADFVRKWAFPILMGLGTGVWAWLTSLPGPIVMAVVLFVVVVGWIIVGLYSGEAWQSKSAQKEAQIKKAPTDEKPDHSELVHIGVPCQRASEPFLSWWQVPIRLRRGFGLNSLEECFVYLGEDSLFLTEKNMRWRSDEERGSAKTTLYVGPDAQWVPIIIRSEKRITTKWGDLPNGTARITGESWLVHGQPDDLLPKHYIVKLEIRSFDRQLPSEMRWSKKFIIDVPEGQEGNGHFLMSPYELDTLVEVGFFDSSLGK